MYLNVTIITVSKYQNPVISINTRFTQARTYPFKCRETTSEWNWKV